MKKDNSLIIVGGGLIALALSLKSNANWDFLKNVFGFGNTAQAPIAQPTQTVSTFGVEFANGQTSNTIYDTGYQTSAPAPVFVEDSFYGDVISGGVGNSFAGGAGQDSILSYLPSVFTPTIQPDSKADIKELARDKAKTLLIKREGVRNTVYKDSVGKDTVGIGHLVTPADNLKFGDTISDARVNSLFNADVEESLNSAINQAEELMQGNNADFIASLTSVNFQLGIGWRSKFPNTWQKLLSGDYEGAINNIKVSLWAKQTPTRTNDFINAIQEIA